MGVKIMLPDEMEAEKNRKIIVSMSNEIELYKNTIKELQGQLQHAYKRIGELTTPKEIVPVDRNYKGFKNESG